MFKVPYRWFYSPGCFFKNITSCWYDLWHGCYNIIRWIPVIWHDQDWDSGFLILIMEYKFRRMAIIFRDHGHHLNNERQVKECFECAELCRHLHEGLIFYSDRYAARHAGRRRGKLWAKAVGQDEKDDMARLGTLIGKKLTHWWD